MPKQDLRAPKDALEKREGFYVYKNLQIQATNHLDGGKRQEIYLNDGRIANAAKLNGNITDEEMLKMLFKTEDFKKLVHSVGVRIEAKNSASDFSFKMIHYGKKDSANSGTHHEIQLKANGVEQVFLLDEVEWSPDDDIIGQFAISFPKSEDLATLSVRFYLRDGFHAPQEEPEETLDTASDEYKKMIALSLVQQGNNARIKKAIEKAQKGEDVTIAYIGGSITQGAGAVPINTECYAHLSFLGFSELFAKNPEKMHYVKAGAGGTSSELGLLRYDRDVTSDGKIKPDVVVIEYAVNDEGDETKGECYEGLVRKIWSSEQKPAVVLLFSVFANNYNLQDRFIPFGKLCDLPMVSVKNAVCEQFDKKSGEGRVLSRQMYFYDVFHPSNNGHRVMADCLINYFKVAAESKASAEIEKLPVYRTEDFDNVQFFGKETIENFVSDLDIGDFTQNDSELQCVERDLERARSPMFPQNWKYSGNGKNVKPFKFNVNCRLLMIIMKDSGAPNAAKVNVTVDGALSRVLNPREIGWTHCSALILMREKEAKTHRVEIALDSIGNMEQEFTILGFGKA